MKSSEIVKHMLNLPKFNRLKQFTHIMQALQHLGAIRYKYIKFATIKNEILYIFTNHPAGTQELKHNSNINLIKNILDLYSQKHNIEFKFNKIIICLDKNTQIYRQNLQKQDKKIILKCNANFINLAKDCEIYEKFENIRKVIQNAN